MNKLTRRMRFNLWIFVAIGSGLLGACGPSQADIEASATQSEAARIATETAQAPTATPIPTSTPTSTPVPSPTSTATPKIPTPTATLSATIYYNRGSDYYDADDLEAAIEAFDRAIELDPEYMEAFFARGGVYADQGNFELAIADFSQAIDLDPFFPGAYYLRAWTYDDTGEFAKAINDYGMVIELEPSFAEAYYWRGRGYFQLAEIESAIADLEKALELDLPSELVEETQANLDSLRLLAAGEIDFSGYWSGNTDQGEVITFEIEGDEIASFSVGFQIPGCENMSPVWSHGGGPKGLIQENRFAIEDFFIDITGAFNSASSAVGTIEISCGEGLTISWTVFRGVKAVRTPTPDDLAKLPQVDIRDDLYSREDGAANFDEDGWIVADNGDWFLLRSFAESVLPIPSGWTSISGPSGASYVFYQSGGSEEYVVHVWVGRDCIGAETSREFIDKMEEIISTDTAFEVLKTEIVDEKKGYLLAGQDAENETFLFGLTTFSKASQGCFHTLNFLPREEEDWTDFYPIFREINAHWFDLANNFLGVDLPPTYQELFE